MTTSLNSLIPFLSEALRLNPSALYERLRALVRLELLESVPGRGPGTGVRFGPEALATLLISHMATDNIGDAAQTTTALSEALLRFPTRAKTKALGGAATFKSALVNILTDVPVGNEVSSLRVHRGEKPWAEIFLRSDTEGIDPCVFHAADDFSTNKQIGLWEEGLLFSVEVRSLTIHAISERLKKIDRDANARGTLQATTKPTVESNTDRPKRRPGTRT
jgi:hypothetical protein